MNSIIHLDSTYRNINLYPNPSEFTVAINGTPPENSERNDVRSVYFCFNYVFMRFKWIGFEETSSGRVASQKLRVRFIVQSPNAFILDSIPTDYHIENDYFVGLLFIIDATNESSIIVSYDSQTFLFITQYQFSESSLAETEGIILNTSFYDIYDTSVSGSRDSIVVLGSSKLLPQSSDEFLLCRGISTTFYVENVSKGWILRIKDFQGFYRNAQLTTDMPCYDPGDVFQIRFQADQNIAEILSSSTFGITEYDLTAGGVGYSIDQEVYVFPETVDGEVAVFRIQKIGRYGEIVHMTMCRAGEGFSVGKSYAVYTLDTPLFLCENITISIDPYPPATGITNSSALITVVDIGTIIIPKQKYKYFCDQRSIHFQLESFFGMRHLLIFFPLKDAGQVGVPINSVPDYYNVKYVNINGIVLESVLPPMPLGNILELISYQTIFPNIIIPTIGFQQPTCFEITISSISLPNLPVRGYNVLLADFPYVLVAFTNSSSNVGNSMHTLISNNPSVTRDAFVCPIANIRNPNIVKFVVVYSSMRVQMKFKTGDDISFRVSLPDGELLRFNDSEILTFGDTVSDDVTNIPMNIDSSVNSKKVYAYSTKRLISATFVIRSLM